MSVAAPSERGPSDRGPSERGPSDRALVPSVFYDELCAELAVRRGELSTAEQGFGAGRPMEGAELREWVAFQAWYERQAAQFIGAWLADVTEEDVFYALTRQIADEGKHHHLFARHLDELGGTMQGWEPEPEWVEWIQVWYPAGADTLEKVAAHNIAGELGAVQAFEDLRPRLPASTNAVLDKVVPDERFHVLIGRRTVERYATTTEAQQRVRDRVWGAFEREQAGRIAFERRLAAVSS